MTLTPSRILARSIITAIVILLVFGACRSGFVPDTPPTPAFSGGGQTIITGYTGNHSFAAHLAWSPFDHAGLVLAGAYNSERSGGLEVSHRYAEALLGYYPWTGDGTRLDLLAGVGVGTMRDVLPSIPPGSPIVELNDTARPWQQFSGDFRKYILQGNLVFASTTVDSGSAFDGIRNELGGTLRVSYVTSRSLMSVDSITPAMPDGLGVTRYPDQGMLFIQPGFFARFGTELMMLEGQVGFTVPMGTPEYSWDFLHLSFGIRFNFARKAIF